MNSTEYTSHGNLISDRISEGSTTLIIRICLALIVLICIVNNLGCSQDEDGDKWRLIESGTKAHLHGVHFVDGKRGWAVGTEGLVLSTADGGLTWNEQSPRKAISRIALNKVHFSTATNGWAVSRMGEVHYTGSGGKSWSHQATPVDKGLLDIYFVSATEGWAIGGYGTILHTVDGGGGWEKQRTASNSIFGQCISQIVKTDGLLEKREPSSTRGTAAKTGWHSRAIPSSHFWAFISQMPTPVGLLARTD